MFFKSEKRTRHPWLVLTVGALAAVGAISIMNSCKCKIHATFSKVGGRGTVGCECSVKENGFR